MSWCWLGNGERQPAPPKTAPRRLLSSQVRSHPTRHSNLDYWQVGAPVSEYGLTMGLRATLQARHVLLLVSGPIDESFPCSLLLLAPRLTIVADEAAMEEV